MDSEEKVRLAARLPTEEIITVKELRELFETNEKPVAYNGFEPSGFAHLGFGLVVKSKVEDFLAAGCEYKLFLADWHAQMNNKMGGDLTAIRKVGEYFTHVWAALGIDLKKIRVVWASDLAAESAYWEKVVRIAKNTSVARMARCLTIMGRRKGELAEAAQYFYPAMQVADIFELDVDICQLGLDQRRANVLARELAPRLGEKKSVCVHHHMLMGLQGPVKMGGFDENAQRDLEISSKMSKSIAKSCIFVHDSPREIREKLGQAFCPPKQSEGNPLLEYAKHLFFRDEEKPAVVERPAKYGGRLEFSTYEELEKAYTQGLLHPADLKAWAADWLSEELRPAREYFEKHPEYLDVFRTSRVTR